MFVGLHALLAQSMAAPELAISEDDGKQFMTSAQNVMRHYSVQSTQKTLDWLAFAGTASGIYIPRLVAVNIRRKRGPVQEVKPGQAASSGGSVHPFIRPDMTSGAGFQEPAE